MVHNPHILVAPHVQRPRFGPRRDRRKARSLSPSGVDVSPRVDDRMSRTHPGTRRTLYNLAIFGDVRVCVCVCAIFSGMNISCL